MRSISVEETAVDVEDPDAEIECKDSAAAAAVAASIKV
jgi:hypothetical protein